eukprot:6614959-Lingulodinium_polyedra.AAC.1
MLAVVDAVLWLGQAAAGRRAFFFIDNDGARALFIAYQSRNKDMRAMLLRFAVPRHRRNAEPMIA